MDIWQSKFLYLPRSCKRKIVGLLGMDKKEVCGGDVEMQKVFLCMFRIRRIFFFFEK